MQFATDYQFYVSPYGNVTNAFSRIQIDTFARYGANVSEIRRSMLMDWAVPRSRKVAVLNWYEDRVFNNHRTAFNLVVSVLFLIWLRLRVPHIVWMRHNFAPHKYNSTGEWAYAFLKRLLSRVAAVTVTMRPCHDLPSLVVPHPMYPTPGSLEGKRDIELLWFGQVRRNKNIPWLLQHLRGANKRILIAGECNEPALRQEILDTAAKHGVQVQWTDRFLPTKELEALLARTRYLVLTHDDKSAIFSGSFMHAASFGANVLIRDSDFARYAASEYSFCKIIDADQGIDTAAQRYVAPEKIKQELLARNGTQAIDSAWLRVFQHMGLKVNSAKAKK